MIAFAERHDVMRLDRIDNASNGIDGLRRRGLSKARGRQEQQHGEQCRQPCDQRSPKSLRYHEQSPITSVIER
jgi:hypothetical protein